MSHTTRVFLFTIAVVVAVLAALMDIVQSKRVTCLALIAAVLAVDNFVWLRDS